MKILFELQSKYKKPEIHICTDVITKEVLGLKELLEGMLSEKITAYREQETRSVTMGEVVRIYSENKKVFLRTSGETYEVRERLYVLEESLKDRQFVRISNSEIVNLSKIEKLDMSYSGTIKMYLKNGDVTYVSRRYVTRIKEMLR